ncbi:hypothetical protein C7401_11299 [Paraburkholderia unamae]|uniref:hypothetical protein n=1 Tax=Paraburkholderia unamae TaxID=219649 RepID=UPI000DC49EAE|nr:hypothetical protein [Paraburkholderia unamae]RAR58783.1 hypothetical protein C7401_11299 [Paraburkholderia unamae]
MSLPEWGYSYNALFVPLTSDWQCSLVPIRDVDDVDRGWKLSYEERQKARKEREEQIEQDQRDFDRYFRVGTSRRAARACSDFGAYIAFIREHLRISGLSAPVDGEGVRRILRDAVRDGRVIPAIDRTWRGSRRVGRSYAPQSWPKRAPDPKPTVYGVLNTGELVPLDEFGRAIDRTPYVPIKVRAAAAASSAARSSTGGKFDWLDSVEAAAGTLLGGDVAADNDHAEDDSAGEEYLIGDAGGDSTPLGDAQPFSYEPDALGQGVVDVAANDRGSTYACDIISAECKGSVLREFPGQYLNSTLNEIQGDAQDGVKDARKALKLLNDGRFKK